MFTRKLWACRMSNENGYVKRGTKVQFCEERVSRTRFVPHCRVGTRKPMFGCHRLRYLVHARASVAARLAGTLVRLVGARHAARARLTRAREREASCRRRARASVLARQAVARQHGRGAVDAIPAGETAAAVQVAASLKHGRGPG